MAENKHKNSGIGIALGSCFGVVLGAACGVIFENIAKATGLGLSIGVFMGSIFDFVKGRK
jgi:F0F1-type ATP synthase assembly protein I